jgi:hypothetical protein
MGNDHITSRSELLPLLITTALAAGQDISRRNSGGKVGWAQNVS